MNRQALQRLFSSVETAVGRVDRRIWILLGIALAVGFPALIGNNYWIRIAGTVWLYTILGIGMNVVVGYAGVLDMGYVAFYAMGAYTYALLASPQFGLHLSFWLLLPAAVAVAVITGLIIGAPSLRLRGDYLAITTMGFAQITRLLLINLDKPINITNGPNGVIRVDPVRIFGFTFDSPTAYYYLLFGFAVLLIIMFSRLGHSRVGRAWAAVRDDEIAARCMGVNTSLYKLLAFALGAAAAGIAGTIFAAWQAAVFPENFSLNELINIYAMVVLGGAGSPWGALLGSLGLVVLGEALREYAMYRMIIYALILLAMMRYRPQGILTIKPRKSQVNVEQAVADNLALRAGLTQPVARREKPLLQVRNLSKAFGGVKAVTNVSFDVHEGEILSVIGPNGAGKTTLFNLITGIYKPDNGEVLLDGQSIVGLPPYQIAAKGLARTFQNIRIFPQLSVLDNVMTGFHPRLRAGVGAAMLRPPSTVKAEQEAEAKAARFLAFFGRALLQRKDEYITSLNYADRRRVEIARALALSPRILLLDEPAAGMNHAEIDEITRHIGELRQLGYTIILVEHQMNVVMNISDRILVMNKGEKLAEGTPQEIQANEDVIGAYLGKKQEASAAVAERPSLATGTPLLRLRDVDTQYGQIKVLKGVNLEIYPGEIVCLLGSNAAGKSTTIKTIIGNVKPTRGTVEFGGKRIDTLNTSDIVNAGIAIVPEGRRIFSRLTVQENLEMGGFLGTDPAAIKRGIDRAFTQFPILAERRFQKGGTLSGGEQQMLAIARALMTEPKLLCLDEPSMGLSPILVQQVFSIIQEINRAGTTIFMVEQNANMALAIAHRGYVLQTGSIILSDQAHLLLGSDAMKSAYLGEVG